MSYEQFAAADLVVRIRSSLLGEDIALASDENAAKRAWPGAIVYVLEEFRHLYAGGELNLDALHLVHRLKKTLDPGARITGTYGYPGSYGMDG
jgi:hypothetical protein